jgi:hypothetical protein
MAQTFGNACAVIIGVNESEIARLALPTVAKDVQVVYDVLVHPERCGYKPENVKLISGSEATKNNIFDAFFWLQDKLQEDEDATAIVYYSGHGMFDRRANQYYLIPYDIGEMRRIRQKAIKADELGAEIAAMQPQRLLVILDCCHAEGMDVKDVDIDGPISAAFPLDLPETKAIPDLDQGGKNTSLLAEGNGRAILNSSTGAESSYIRKDGAMSLFTYHLIEALTGHAPHGEDDKTVLVTDVMSYVTRKVAETARNEGRQQTPVMKTTGVFPVAMLLGGEGTKGLGSLPDPLLPLPPLPPSAGSATTNNVGGDQYNFGDKAVIGQVGNTINTGGGSYIGRKIVYGDDIGGNKKTIHGDSIGDDITIKHISGGTNVIGSGASLQQTNYHGVSEAELTAFFAPIMEMIARLDNSAENQQALSSTLQTLRTEMGRGDATDAHEVAKLAQLAAAASPNAILFGKMFAECQAALEDAYDVDSFTVMLRGKIGKRLDLLTSLKVGFSSVISNVLLFAEYEGWTAQLIDGAVAYNPNNRKLRQFSERYNTAKEE